MARRSVVQDVEFEIDATAEELKLIIPAMLQLNQMTLLTPMQFGVDSLDMMQMQTQVQLALLAKQQPLLLNQKGGE